MNQVLVETSARHVHLSEEHIEILARATHNVGQLEVLQQVRGQLHPLVAVGGTEVNIVVKDPGLNRPKLITIQLAETTNEE